VDKKVPTFIYRYLQENPNSSGLQFEVAYWPALAVGGAAQLAAARPLPERTDFGPAVAARRSHLGYIMHQPAILWPYHAIFSGNVSLFLEVSITRY